MQSSRLRGFSSLFWEDNKHPLEKSASEDANARSSKYLHQYCFFWPDIAHGSPRNHPVCVRNSGGTFCALRTQSGLLPGQWYAIDCVWDLTHYYHMYNSGCRSPKVLKIDTDHIRDSCTLAKQVDTPQSEVLSCYGHISYEGGPTENPLLEFQKSLSSKSCNVVLKGELRRSLQAQLLRNCTWLNSGTKREKVITITDHCDIWQQVN